MAQTMEQKMTEYSRSDQFFCVNVYTNLASCDQALYAIWLNEKDEEKKKIIWQAMLTIFGIYERSYCDLLDERKVNMEALKKNFMERRYGQSEPEPESKPKPTTTRKNKKRKTMK